MNAVLGMFANESLGAIMVRKTHDGHKMGPKMKWRATAEQGTATFVGYGASIALALAALAEKVK